MALEKNTSFDPLFTRSFLDLKVILTFMVVWRHCLYFIRPGFPEDISNSFLRVVDQIGQNYTSSVIPVFFLISGYLFFLDIQNFSWRKYLEKIKKRARSLLVPYLIWPILLMLFPILWKTLKTYSTGEMDLSFLGEYLTPRVYWIYYPDGNPYFVPLWFIRNLMIVCLMSPLIFRALKRLPIVTLIFLLVMQKLLSFDNFWYHIIEAFLFFSYGAALVIHRLECGRILFRLRHLLLAGNLILIILPFLGISIPYSLGIYLCGLSLLFLGCFCQAKHGNLFCKQLQKSTFFVFLLHAMYNHLPFIGSIMRGLVSDGCPDVLILLQHLLGALLLYGYCHLAFLLLERLMPKVLGFITGGR